DGMEKNVIEVVQEGLAKGILKPDFQSHVALAEAYYYSDQPVLAIDAYRKAAPLDDDGETYLNLARLLWQENRIPEAKEAAKQALAKGVKKPDEAKKILALPAK
ncbi:MAG TPA: tetratricopeptide repeat protein, partial [Lysobacter sp.]|nr:tetratricopeptide repeat protein [Lysobacter sp.]